MDQLAIDARTAVSNRADRLDGFVERLVEICTDQQREIEELQQRVAALENHLSVPVRWSDRGILCDD